MVLWLTLYDRAMSVSTSPASRRAIASLRWWPVSFGLRPRMTPLAFARSRPSPVRVRISSRSNSANPPNTVSISRPCAVVVSAHVSLRDLKPAPFSAIVPSRLRRSRVDLDVVNNLRFFGPQAANFLEFRFNSQPELRTEGRCGSMSGLVRKADVVDGARHVSFVLQADLNRPEGWVYPARR